MKSLLFLVLAMLTDFTFQQPPPPPLLQRCFETPESWSGFFFVIDYEQGNSDHGNIYYNRTEMRIFYDYDSYNGRTSDVMKVWYLYKERKSYTYDENTRLCTSEDISPTERFPLFGAPEGATFHHRDRLGSFISNLGVTTDYFRMDTEDGGVFHGYYSPLYDSFQLDRMCVPVIQSYEKIDTAPTHQRDTHFTFMNITTDHIDSLVWVIPNECFRQ